MYGASEPLEGKPVEAKNPFDPPDAPEKPDITGYSPSTCSLEWKPPANNGGRPITGYVIEKRERGGEWIRVSKLLFACALFIHFISFFHTEICIVRSIKGISKHYFFFASLI